MLAGCSKKRDSQEDAVPDGALDEWCTNALVHGDLPSREARYYKKLVSGKVRCDVCPQRCVVAPGKRGGCRSRVNLDGSLHTLVYGNLCMVDRASTKGVSIGYALLDGSILRIRAAGCCMNCDFCITHETSQANPENVPSCRYTPEALVALAKASGCKVIAFTGNEPITFIEYTLDTARLAKKAGLLTHLSTAGNGLLEPLKDLMPHIDAAEVGLKGFSREFYEKHTGDGDFEAILRSTRLIGKSVEQLTVGYVMIPGLNDQLDLVKQMLSWAFQSFGPETMIILYRFMPSHKLSHLPMMDLQTMQAAKRLGEDLGFHYVFIQDYAGELVQNELKCHNCAKTIARRSNGKTERWVVGGKCQHCGAIVHLPGARRASAVPL